MGRYLWLLIGMLMAVGGRADSIILAADGNSAYEVAVASDAIPAEQFAAAELSAFLTRITGAPFRLCNEDAVAPGRMAIYVGNTKFAQKNGINVNELNREEWIIRPVAGKNLIISGGRPRGTLYGVYRFLEKTGCRFLAENCNIVPTRSRLELNLSPERKQPCFSGRQINDDLEWGDAHPASTLFKVRNGGDAYVNDQFGSYDQLGSPGPHHTFFAYSKNWPDDPTLFSLNAGGQRLRAVSSAGPGQLCMTNPQARKLMLRQLREFIREDRKNPPPYPEIYDLSQNDNGDCCVCPQCKKLAEREGSYAAPLIDFINDIARGIHRDYPEIKLRTFAYVYGKEPPKTIRPVENVIIRLAPMGYEFKENRDTLAALSSPHNRATRALLERWSAVSDHLAIWDYWILFATDYTAPYADVAMLPENLKFYRDHHYNKIYVECERPYLTSFSALRRYVGLQLMLDPDQPVNRLIDDFMTGYYGPRAAPLLTAYLRYMEERQKNYPFPVGQIPAAGRDYLDLAFFTRTLGWLDEAVRQTNDPEQKKAIMREYIPLLGGLAQRYPFLLAENHQQPLGFEMEKRLASFDAILADAMVHYLPLPADRARFESGLQHLAKDFREMVKTVPPPPELKNTTMVAMYPVQGRTMGKAKRVDDPDSPVGRAIMLGENANNRTVNGMLNLSVNDFNRAQCLVSRNIPLTEIRDEQYHLYRIGKATLVNDSAYVAAGWTCEIQFPLDAFYRPGVGNGNGNRNTYQVYAAVKVQGPQYFPHSSRENGIFVARVILVR